MLGQVSKSTGLTLVAVLTICVSCGSAAAENPYETELDAPEQNMSYAEPELSLPEEQNYTPASPSPEVEIDTAPETPATELEAPSLPDAPEFTPSSSNEQTLTAGVSGFDVQTLVLGGATLAGASAGKFAGAQAATVLQGDLPALAGKVGNFVEGLKLISTGAADAPVTTTDLEQIILHQTYAAQSLQISLDEPLTAAKLTSGQKAAYISWLEKTGNPDFLGIAGGTGELSVSGMETVSQTEATELLEKMFTAALGHKGVQIQANIPQIVERSVATGLGKEGIAASKAAGKAATELVGDLGGVVVKGLPYAGAAVGGGTIIATETLFNASRAEAATVGYDEAARDAVGELHYLEDLQRSDNIPYQLAVTAWYEYTDQR